MHEIDTLLICNSNMFVPTVLTEVLSHPQKKYIVISDTDNIRQFFEFLDIENVLFYYYGLNNSFKRFAFMAGKKNLLNFVSQYVINKVVFFHAEYGGMANWLLCKLSKHTMIKYCKLYDSIPAPKAQISLRTIKLWAGEYFYWGQKMEILKGTSLFPSLPQSFFKKIKAEIIHMPVDIILNKDFLNTKMKEYKISGKYVLLTGTAIQNICYQEDIYISFINKLIDFLGESEVLSKCHPRYNGLYGKEKILVQIPSFIPGNVLIDNFDYYIGIESTLLVEAAKAGKVSISIIDWLRPNGKLNRVLHNFFDNRLQGEGVIYYPQSMDELKRILNKSLSQSN